MAVTGGPAGAQDSARKPELNLFQIVNMSFGFFGIQIGFALQNGNVSRIFQTLGADMSTLPLLWLAGPITGLIMQPIIGYFSDKTWGPLGRRRPYFLIGAILTTLALFIMPNSPWLWVAAGTLWILDASLNITMEPFRAFVGDMLSSKQRPLGYSMQTIFIGAGAVLASIAPFVFNALGVSNEAADGVIPDNVKWSFYIGGAALFMAVMWTVFTTKEYSPDELEAFGKDEDNIFEQEGGIKKDERPEGSFFSKWGLIIAALGTAFTAAVYFASGDQQFYILGGGLIFLGVLYLWNSQLVKTDRNARNFLSDVLGDLTTMPNVMKRLAFVQFFSWVGLFIMWIYTTPAVALQAWETADASSKAYQDAGDWVGIMFAVQNGGRGDLRIRHRRHRATGRHTKPPRVQPACGRGGFCRLSPVRIAVWLADPDDRSWHGVGINSRPALCDPGGRSAGPKNGHLYGHLQFLHRAATDLGRRHDGANLALARDKPSPRRWRGATARRPLWGGQFLPCSVRDDLCAS
ncbi:MAG: hypothetical protein Hens2KO_26160 [Henriciella sp.]